MLNAPPPGLQRKAEAAPAEQSATNNYDEWSGYGGALFAGLKEDQEDREADECYENVDAYLLGKRQKKHLEKINELNKAYAKDQVNIKSKFVDVKRRLADISREEWEALSDAQDLVK